MQFRSGSIPILVVQLEVLSFVRKKIVEITVSVKLRVLNEQYWDKLKYGQSVELQTFCQMIVLIINYTGKL